MPFYLSLWSVSWTWSPGLAALHQVLIKAMNR